MFNDSLLQFHFPSVSRRWEKVGREEVGSGGSLFDVCPSDQFFPAENLDQIAKDRESLDASVLEDLMSQFLLVLAVGRKQQEGDHLHKDGFQVDTLSTQHRLTTLGTLQVFSEMQMKLDHCFGIGDFQMLHKEATLE